MRYSDEEKQKIVDDFIDLSNEQIKGFLRQRELPVTGTKEIFRALLQEKLEREHLSYTELVAYLDQISPWGKQHVFLLKGFSQLARPFRDRAWVETRLKEHGLRDRLNAPLRLILPEQLTVSEISYRPELLRVIAIARRDEWSREHDYDRYEVIEGRQVEFRAYSHHVDRGLIIFEWDLIHNTAALRISQLPSGGDYEEEFSAFARLTSKWLNLHMFEKLDIRRAIRSLHELAEKGEPEARPQAIDYRTFGGRVFSGRSATSETSVLGEVVIDSAMKNLRDLGTGQLGNFYWLPTACGAVHKERHVFLNGPAHRINFTTANDEKSLRHVLDRIRAHCS